MLSDSVGQNHVLPSTTPRTRSARSTLTAIPMGPPQSWPITTNPSRARSSTSSPTTAACSVIV
jgi:hypothetical protein